jgi:RNA polymerase sigma factor for flagellar operon FliA
LIGKAIRQVVAGAEAACAQAGTFTVHDVLLDVCAAASFCASPDLRDLVVRSCSNLSRRSGANSGAVAAAVKAAYDQYTTDSSDSDVTAVIDDLNAKSLPGEQVAWAVIGVESLRHVPLVRKEAHKAARVWERSAEDLEGYGWRGLRLALRSYSPDEWMFSTYACPKIRGAIHDGVRSEHHLPKRLTTFVNTVDRERDALAAALGRHPSLEELSERVGVHLDKLKTLPSLATPSSLDETDHAGGSVGSQLPGETDVADDVEQQAVASAVRTALEELDPDDAEALLLLVVEGCSYAEARRRTGMSHRQLRSRRERALVQMGALLEDWR